MNVEGAINSGTGCISNPTTYHNDIRSIAMTSKIVTPTTAEIQERHEAQTVPTWGNESVLLDWSRIHQDRGVLLRRLEAATTALLRIQKENGLPEYQRNSDSIQIYCNDGLQQANPRIKS